MLAKSENGQIQVRYDVKFYDWTREKIVEEAFNLDFRKFAAAEKPIVVVEGTTDIDYIKKAAKHFSARDKNNVERYLKMESGCVFELA